ncbi:MAG: 50S ribosomal protein L25/general stress protein Ctc, partial [Phreatobacter sp.]
KGADVSPGIKRGGTINLVEHSITLICKADSIPEAVDIDVSELNLGSSVHLNDVVLPAGARATTKDNPTLLSIVAPSGFAEPEAAAAEAAPAAAAPAAKK